MYDKQTCHICGQVAGDRSRDLISQVLGDREYKRRAVLESESFIVFPSIGPLITGHVLICPKAHVEGIAEIIGKLAKDYAEIKSATRKLLQEVYGVGVHFFEHGGPAGSERPICSVGHAHMHAVPANVDILGKLLDEGAWISLRHHEVDLPSFCGDAEYLYYETPGGESYGCLGNHAAIASQYMRRVFADALGCPEMWNWRTDPRAEQLAETANVLSAAAQRRRLGLAA